MYIYLKTYYDQWRNGQDDTLLVSRSEDFIDLVHHRLHYNKDEMRKFLYKQSWFLKDDSFKTD